MAKRDTLSRTTTPLTRPTNRNAEKYQRILDAALAVFAEKGFFVSRVSDIADRANVADGTVYLYFKNKDEILASAINTAFDGFMRTARTELEKLAVSDGAFAAPGLSASGGAGIKPQHGSRVPDGIAAEHPVLSEFSHQHLVEYFTSGARGDFEGKATGEFRQDMPEKIAANCFFGAIDEMVTSWVLSEKTIHWPMRPIPLIDILLNGMRPTKG